MLSNRITAVGILSGCAIAAGNNESPFSEAETRTIYQFPNNTYVENLAVRPNGQILVSVLTSPQVWLIDPELPDRAVLVYESPSVLGLSGIVEYQPDVFAIAGGNVSLSTGEAFVGSWSIWSLDLGGLDITSNESISAAPPAVSKIADIPPATFLNGMAVLTGPDKQLLIVGDVKAGTVYSVDIATGAYEVVINNTFTAPATDYAFGRSATDGIQIRKDIMYFANIGQKTLSTVRLGFSDGTPVGEFQTIAHAKGSRDQWDDFTLDEQGNAWMAAGGANTIQKINTHTGKVSIVAGDVNSTAIAEPTSAKFGRRECDLTVLYVTTAGGLATPVNGDVTVGGQVVAVMTGPWRGSS
jgi:sugar lactone lactonase YvrE